MPQYADPIAKPHSAVPNPASSSRSWKIPIAVSVLSSVTAKQTYVPAWRCRSVQAMNRSKPSTVVGGGEMKRDTSSVVSSAQSDGASDARSSRKVTCEPASTGRPCRQSVLIVLITGSMVRCREVDVQFLSVRHLFHD